MSLKCIECGWVVGSRSKLRNHYIDKHGGTIEAPDEYLGQTPSEQRDLELSEVSVKDVEIEYLVEKEPPETKRVSLYAFEDSDNDGDGDSDVEG